MYHIQTNINYFLSTIFFLRYKRLFKIYDVAWNKPTFITFIIISSLNWSFSNYIETNICFSISGLSKVSIWIRCQWWPHRWSQIPAWNPWWWLSQRRIWTCWKGSLPKAELHLRFSSRLKHFRAKRCHSHVIDFFFSSLNFNTH